MKTILRKTMLLPVMLAAFLLTSCENEDWRLEEEIIGRWSYLYEDKYKFEEETYNFTPQGDWTYQYLYRDVYGEDEAVVDAGTYEISFGRLVLYSNFSNESYSYSLTINGPMLELRNGSYYAEFERIR